MANMRAVRFNGLNRDVYIPDDIEVIIDIVPSRRTNIRSNQPFSGQNKTTWHDTGNPNSDAWGERNWLHSGAGGAYVGYNFAFDAKRIIQLTPLNEVTWHAGTPDGNKYSWGAEQCLNTDWNRALYVGAALHGGLCAAMGWNVDTALVQHYVWYGKHCPAQIRNRGVWPTVVQMTRDAATRAREAAGGGQLPQPSGAFKKGTVVKTTAETGLNLRQGPGLKYPITGVLPLGTQGEVISDVPQTADGFTWYDTKGIYGTGFIADEFLEKVSDPVAPQRFDGSKDMTVNGKLYHAWRGQVTALEGLRERQWASTESAIRVTHAAGAKIKVVGWVEGEEVNGENRWWVIDIDGGRLWVGGTVEKP